MRRGREQRFRATVAALVLVGLSLPATAGDLVAVRVNPEVTYAPANLFVRTTVEARTENRVLEVTAESADFYRRSEVPLAGEAAPRVSFFRFHALPAGDYLVRATVRDARGDAVAFSEVRASVLGIGDR